MVFPDPPDFRVWFWIAAMAACVLKKKKTIIMWSEFALIMGEEKHSCPVPYATWHFRSASIIFKSKAPFYVSRVESLHDDCNDTRPQHRFAWQAATHTKLLMLYYNYLWFLGQAIVPFENLTIISSLTNAIEDHKYSPLPSQILPIQESIWYH